MIPLFLPFLLGLVAGGLLVSIFVVFITLSIDVAVADAIPTFIYKWQTLIAGFLSIVAAGSAIISVLISIRHTDKIDKKRKKEQASALCSVIYQDVRQTMQIVEELHDWAGHINSGNNLAIPYKDFVMGESLVNTWTAFQFVPPSVAKDLFTYSHAMFDCQIRTREFGVNRAVSRTTPNFTNYVASIDDAKTTGQMLLRSLEAEIHPN